MREGGGIATMPLLTLPCNAALLPPALTLLGLALRARPRRRLSVKESSEGLHCNLVEAQNLRARPRRARNLLPSPWARSIVWGGLK